MPKFGRGDKSLSLPPNGNKAREIRISFCPKMKPNLSKPSPFLQVLQARSSRLRIAVPRVPRHPLPSERRALIAAQRAAEFAAWQASGGDFLRR